MAHYSRNVEAINILQKKNVIKSVENCLNTFFTVNKRSNLMQQYADIYLLQSKVLIRPRWKKVAAPIL